MALTECRPPKSRILFVITTTPLWPPNKSKKIQGNPNKKAWIPLDSFGRIRAFQWVTAIPNKKILSPFSFPVRSAHRLLRGAFHISTFRNIGMNSYFQQAFVATSFVATETADPPMRQGASRSASLPSIRTQIIETEMGAKSKGQPLVSGTRGAARRFACRTHDACAEMSARGGMPPEPIEKLFTGERHAARLRASAA
jgi:hypothetical protein